MTNLEKIKYLTRYIESKRRFYALSDEMERIRSEAMRITQLITDMPGATSFNDKIANAVENLVMCVDMMEHESEVMRSSMKKVKSAIETISDASLQEILIRKYINDLSFTEIAIIMHYCTKQISRKHLLALEMIQIPED